MSRSGAPSLEFNEEAGMRGKRAGEDAVADLDGGIGPEVAAPLRVDANGAQIERDLAGFVRPVDEQNAQPLAYALVPLRGP